MKCKLKKVALWHLAHYLTFFVPAHKVTCASLSLSAVNLRLSKIILAFLNAREGEVAWANAECVRIKKGEREAAKARRAKEVRLVQKQIKVDKARRMVAAAATATKNEKEEETARKTTADKRQRSAKRQRFCVERRRRCLERMRGRDVNTTTNGKMRDYHSGGKGNGDGNSDNDSCGNGNGICDGNGKCRATAVANDLLAGDAAVGAVGVVNDRDNIGGGCRPSGFNKEDALVLMAEATATLIVDNTKVVMSALLL